MTGKKRIQKYEKFGLRLTQAERTLILEGVANLPEEIARFGPGNASQAADHADPR